MSDKVPLVRVLTSATGNSTPITLGLAYSQLFMTPAEAGAVDGRTYTWLIVDGNNWELVKGVYTASGTTAARTTVLASRISGTLGTSRISLSGTAQVRIVEAAVDMDGVRGTRSVTGTSDTLAATDLGYVVTYSNASAVAVSLAQAGTASLYDGWASWVQNLGVGTVTITPATSTINGSSTLVLAQNLGAFIWSDGTNYHAYIIPVTKPLLAANNLSDVGSAVTSRANLGINQGAALAASQDFNLVTAPGTYYTIDANSVNAPLPAGSSNWYLEVEFHGVTGPNAKQIATAKGTGVAYIRVLAVGVWGSWLPMMTGDQNLSNIANPATALSNLGGAAKSANLSDMASAATALNNLAGVSYGASQSLTAAQQLQALANTAQPFNCGRLSFVGTTAIKFAPYNGDLIKINGSVYRIPAAGIAGVANTSVFVNGTGASNLAASTLYYVYAFSNSGVVTADFSTTAHATSSTAGNIGVEIKSGDDTRSLIGMVFTNASSQFASSATTQYVRSWFNRPRMPMRGAILGSNVGLNATALELASGARCSFVCWADDAVLFNASMGYFSSATGCIISFYINYDGSTAANLVTANTDGSGRVLPMAVSDATSLSEGQHYATMFGSINTGSGSAYSASFLSGAVG